MEGYLAGCTVCLDTGNDGSCTGDLTATTEPDGTFLFISDQYADAPLLLEPGGSCIDTGNTPQKEEIVSETETLQAIN